MMSEVKKQNAKSRFRAAEGKGLQAVLGVLYDLISNPVILCDVSFMLLASFGEGNTDDEMWNELVNLRTLTRESIDSMYEENLFDQYAKNDEIVVLRSPKQKYDRIAASVFDDEGTHIATICVLQYNKKVSEEDMANIQLCSKYLSSALKKSIGEGRVSRLYQEQLVGALIENRPISPLYSNKVMTELYKGLKKNIFVGVIDVIQGQNPFGQLVYYSNIFTHCQPNYKFFIYFNNIVALMSTDAPILSIKKDLKKNNDFFMEHNIYAGISDSFQNLSELRTYFKQALNALNFGLNLSDGRNIFRFSDFRLESFIKDYADKAFELCHPIINYINQYDKEKNTSYKAILFKYLLCGRDPVKAAKSACMEYNFFCRKLREIEDIFDIDFTNMNTVFGLFCGMKMQEYFPEKL